MSGIGLRIPERLRHEAEEIFKLTDPFCAEHLDAEYAELCHGVFAPNQPLRRKLVPTQATDTPRIDAGLSLPRR